MPGRDATAWPTRSRVAAAAAPPFIFGLTRPEDKKLTAFLETRELLREFPKKAAYSSKAYGRGAGVGRGRGVGAGLGVGVCLGVEVAVGVGDADAVAVAVGVAVAVAVGVGEGDPQGLTGQLKISIEAIMVRALS